MNNDAFTYHAEHTSNSIQKQMDLMASRLRAMADNIQSNEEFAADYADPRDQLQADLEALRCSMNDLHTNLMSNMNMAMCTTLLVDGSELLATKVEG